MCPASLPPEDATSTLPDSEHERTLTTTRLPEGLTSALFPEGIALDRRGRAADRRWTPGAHVARRAAPRIAGAGVVRPPGGDAAQLHAGSSSGGGRERRAYACRISPGDRGTAGSGGGRGVGTSGCRES